MTDSYRELLQEAVDAFNDRDPAAWAVRWTADCEWHPFLTAREEGDPGYHGHNGIRAWFEDVDEMFTRIHADLNRFRQIGDRLVVLGSMTATTRGTDEEVDSEVGWVVEPRGGLLHRGWAYSSHDEAISAAEGSR